MKKIKIIEGTNFSTAGSKGLFVLNEKCDKIRIIEGTMDNSAGSKGLFAIPQNK